METGSEGSVHGDQDSLRSSVSSTDLRLRENFTDNVCAESHSRLCRAGVRAPSAEPNRTRNPAFVRARARAHVPLRQKDYCMLQHSMLVRTDRFCRKTSGGINSGEVL